MNHNSFTASLCSDTEELTDRKPCALTPMGPCVEDMQPITNGVADRITVWCAGCGGLVYEIPLPALVVIDGRAWSNVQLPLWPMRNNDWAEA